MAYKGEGRGSRLKQEARGGKLGQDIFVGRSVKKGAMEASLDNAIRAAVNSIPQSTLRRKKTFVVTSITVDVVGDPDVGAYGVTIM